MAAPLFAFEPFPENAEATGKNPLPTKSKVSIFFHGSLSFQVVNATELVGIGVSPGTRTGI